MEGIHTQKKLEISRLRDAQKVALATSAAHMGIFEQNLRASPDYSEA
jgi:hypothetical protein